ncbi:hypothetical protein BEL05_05030 [Shewanella colwelliana]|uniref:Uncharacterized protein n=1 Tax=Shewanella colwelliana TaxID=23 RepID=A0A1E5IP67_SHECO|nr:hypothetical protein BEL05_05030 [Shewanella colwelliana]
MNNCESLVLEYLRADRAMFVNTQCCIQLIDALNPDTSGPHWYCDLLAVNFKEKQVYLCEVTHAKNLSSLINRLKDWELHWSELKTALVRDSSIPNDWEVRPWVFIPSDLSGAFDLKIANLGLKNMPKPEVTALEDVMPWKYRSWNRLV